jgi:hypothetical protein
MIDVLFIVVVSILFGVLYWGAQRIIDKLVVRSKSLSANSALQISWPHRGRFRAVDSLPHIQSMLSTVAAELSEIEQQHRQDQLAIEAKLSSIELAQLNLMALVISILQQGETIKTDISQQMAESAGKMLQATAEARATIIRAVTDRKLQPASTHQVTSGMTVDDFLSRGGVAEIKPLSRGGVANVS